MGAGLLSLMLCSAYALEGIKLQLGHIEGAGWEAGEVALVLGLAGEDQVSLDLNVGDLKLPPPFTTLTGFSFRCPEATVSQELTTCKSGILSLGTLSPPLASLRGRIVFEQRNGGMELRVDELQFASGTMDIRVVVDEARWQADLQGQALALTQAFVTLSRFLKLPAIVVNRGRLTTLAATFRGGMGPPSVGLEARMEDVAFSDTRGLHAGEDVDLALRAELHRGTGGWLFKGNLAVTTGQIYSDPVHVAISSLPGTAGTGSPLTMDFEGTWSDISHVLTLTRLAVVHPGVMEVGGELSVRVRDGLQVDRVRLVSGSTPLKELYEVYLQPFTVGTALDKLAANGEVEFSVDWVRNGASSAHLVLHDVNLADRAGVEDRIPDTTSTTSANEAQATGSQDPGGHFGVLGLDGMVHWGTGPHVEETRFTWDGGHVYRVELGASELSGTLQGRGFLLAQAFNVPVFDGSLRVESLVMGGLGSPDATWQFQGSLSPVSMEALSRAFGWPSMGGTLSGIIPAVRYANGIVTVGGALLMRVFDGAVVIHNLRLEHPFGIVPVLSADIDVTNIDLDALTRAFTFGKIQGRLSGHVHNLVLDDWMPRSFDANFATPPSDRSRHRISQRAVDNLVGLGGGAIGGISKTFLRFFDEFSYDRLGLSCRLRNGVCVMNGVAPARAGYYIVKGGGLPRIDVVGYNHRVDWSALVQRLENATKAGRPIIK